MSDDAEQKDADQWVGLVISELVRADRIVEYEEWSAGICEAAKSAPGFRARQVIEPRDSTHLEYLIVLKFDTLPNLDLWHESDDCRDWLAKSAAFIERRSHHDPGVGVEMWYTRPDPVAISPPFWKQVVIGVIAVYPSIILLRWLTTPILAPLKLPPDLNLLISVFLLSCLLTWPLMPMLTRFFNRWLYGRGS